MKIPGAWSWGRRERPLVRGDEIAAGAEGPDPRGGRHRATGGLDGDRGHTLAWVVRSRGSLNDFVGRGSSSDCSKNWISSWLGITPTLLPPGGHTIGWAGVYSEGGYLGYGNKKGSRRQFKNIAVYDQTMRVFGEHLMNRWPSFFTRTYSVSFL